jgi:hypothetical protein
MRSLLTLVVTLALSATLVPASRAALLSSVSTAGPTTHVVVLADGRSLGARTRPVIAFGKVSFMSAAGGLVSLDARVVDVAATRARAGLCPPSATRVAWTDRNLAEAAGRVQVVGDTAGPPPVVLLENEQLDRLRTRMEEVEDRIAELGPDDPATARLMQVQQELQSEVTRLLHGSGGPNG